MNHSRSKSQWKVRPPSYSLQCYLSYHGQAAVASLRRLIQAPFNTLLTLGVIAIALALPAGLFVVLQNMNAIGGSLQRGNQISLYLKMQTSPSEIENLSKQLKERHDVASVNVITPQQGLAEFERESGINSVLQHLPDNPLPTVIEVYPITSLSVPDGIKHLFTELQQLPAVDIAKLDMQWLQRLQSIVDLGERIVIALTLFFGIAVLLVIGNTIRLATEQQHREIEVIKLIGGTLGFIRRPFLYTGIYYGLLGGLLACTTIGMVLLWLEKPLQELFNYYHSTMNFIGLTADTAIMILLFGALLGLCGSWFAVSRHLANNNH